MNPEPITPLLLVYRYSKWLAAVREPARMLASSQQLAASNNTERAICRLLGEYHREPSARSVDAIESENQGARYE